MRDLCYWSVGDGDYAYMLGGLALSMRAAGVEDDLHVFADRKVPGAVTHLVGPFDKTDFRFKFDFLRQIARLPYRWFVFLDADTWFVRRPPPLIELAQGSPVHAFLETDFTVLDNPRRRNWFGCPLHRYVQIMRAAGVTSRGVYNLNGGFWMVERDAIEPLCQLVFDFWGPWKAAGFRQPEEPALSYAIHMMSPDPDRHVQRRHLDVWATDWTGEWAGRLPTGAPWIWKDFFTGDGQVVNPAIVHAVQSKQAIVAAV